MGVANGGFHSRKDTGSTSDCQRKVKQRRISSKIKGEDCEFMNAGGPKNSSTPKERVRRGKVSTRDPGPGWFNYAEQNLDKGALKRGKVTRRSSHESWGGDDRKDS